MTAITVYTKPACVQCNATFRALDKAGVDYAKVDITVDSDAPAEVEPNGVVDTLTPQLSDTTAASTFLADASVVV